MTVTTTNTDLKIVKTELFDADVMDVFLQQKQFSRRDMQNLSRYKRGRRHANEVEVVYHFGKGLSEFQLGRLYPHNNQGLQAFPFDIRNPLLEKYYWDIDMENAHYNILAHLADEWGIKNDSIKYYINNREASLASVSSNRGVAKTAFLKVAYGGEIRLYNENYNDDGIEAEGDFTLLKAIEKEMKAVVEMCWSKYSCFQKLVSKKSNPKFSLFALILQTEERKCLLAMDEYLKTQNRSMDVLIHDGGEVRKVEGETSFPIHLLKGCEEAILSKTGYSMRVVNKELKHKFDMKLLLTKKEQDYENMKAEFEKTHFKLMNPIKYIKVVDSKIEYLSRTDLLQMYENYYIGESELFVDRWIKDPKIRTYERVVFKPKLDVDVNEFNLFTGFACEDVEGDISVPQSILRLVCNNDQTAFDYIEKWLAHLIQKPYERIGKAIIIQGEQGVGKDTFFNFIGDIIGDYFFNTSNIENQVFGRFNGHLQHTLFLKMEEISFDIMKANASKLKSMITSKTTGFEDKGMKTITLDNYIRMVMTTNQDVPIVLEQGDRRFVLIRASAEKKGDFQFWNKTYQELNKKEVQSAYFHHLCNLDISNFNPNEIPITEFYNEVKQSFIPYHAKWFQRLIEDDPDRFESWKFGGRDLYISMKEASKFELSETKFGRDMRVYPVISKIRSNNGTKYSFHMKEMKDFLISKGWWIEY